MNIFYLSNNVRFCAQYHVDKHTIKMCTEYAQILSTAHRILDGTEYIDATSGRRIKRWKLTDNREEHLYLATHYNHPSVKWCIQSKQNYAWLYQLFLELLCEYNYRYSKIHACTKLVPYLGLIPHNISSKPFTEPTPAMSNEYIVANDSIQSYRNYYKYGKFHLHSWKNRPTPNWILN